MPEPKYGDKRDYPKIELYRNGVYWRSTTWAKTCKEAKEKLVNSDPIGLRGVHITAHFAKRRS